MLLAADNDLVQAFATDRPNQAVPSLLGRVVVKRDGFVPNAHRMEALSYD
jgi:hypothetical protein